MPSTNPDLLTREEAAAYLGVKPQTMAVWACTKKYALPMVKIGRNRVFYRRVDLEAFVSSHVVNPVSEERE